MTRLSPVFLATLLGFGSLLTTAPTFAKSDDFLGVHGSDRSQLLDSQLMYSQSSLQTKQVNRRWPPGGKGSRGLFCAISPWNAGALAMWSDRPLFLWQGEGTQLRVRDAMSEEVVWESNLAPGQQQAMYAGRSLLPGYFYQWQVLTANSNQQERERWNTFGIMDADAQATITQELQTLEASLRQQGASASTILLRQVDYLIEKNLISDAMRLVYQVQNPSPEILQERQQIQEICNTSSSTGS